MPFEIVLFKSTKEPVLNKVNIFEIFIFSKSIKSSSFYDKVDAIKIPSQRSTISHFIYGSADCDFVVPVKKFLILSELRNSKSNRRTNSQKWFDFV